MLSRSLCLTRSGRWTTYWQRPISVTYRRVFARRFTKIPSRIFGSGSTPIKGMSSNSKSATSLARAVSDEELSREILETVGELLKNSTVNRPEAKAQQVSSLSTAFTPSTCLIESPRLGLAGRPLTSWRHRRPVSSPCIGFLSVQVPDAYWHGGKPVRKASLIANRPPLVQEDLKRTPHRNPAADRKAFPYDLSNTAALH